MPSPWQLGIILAVAFGCGVIGEYVGKPKGRRAWGFWLGFLFLVIGILIVAVMPASQEGQVRMAAARLRAEEGARRRIDAGRPEYKP